MTTKWLWSWHLLKSESWETRAAAGSPAEEVRMYKLGFIAGRKTMVISLLLLHVTRSCYACLCTQG